MLTLIRYLALAWLAQMPFEVMAAPTAEASPELPIIHYDGPKYSLKPADLLARAHAIATNGSWDAPADMPRITLQDGQVLDFGAGSLVKRKGDRDISAWTGGACDGTRLAQVHNFGCGTACFNLPQTAFSGLVLQSYEGNPYPTMDVWSSPGCVGKYQHFGIIGTRSCTKSNQGGYVSFVGYWNC